MKHTIITVSRQFGSGGRKIGHLAAESLEIPCYDRSIIDKAVEISELNPDFIEKNEQQSVMMIKQAYLMMNEEGIA
ncbi:MAG: cytidylate kinase-like family protein [Tannerellaceae bacterium]|nr:cytidylate kinase-like family protein [Tannerellaceae bacterium]